jgi:hypothetical protein
MSDGLAAALDAAMDAEVAYARDRVPDGRGWAMPPRDQVERLIAAALKAASPPAIIKMDAETTPEMLEQLAARWKAVWERDKGKPLRVLPPDEEIIVGYVVDGKTYHPADVTILRQDPP